MEEDDICMFYRKEYSEPLIQGNENREIIGVHVPQQLLCKHPKHIEKKLFGNVRCKGDVNSCVDYEEYWLNFNPDDYM